MLRHTVLAVLRRDLTELGAVFARHARGTQPDQEIVSPLFVIEFCVGDDGEIVSAVPLSQYREQVVSSLSEMAGESHKPATLPPRLLQRSSALVTTPHNCRDAHSRARIAAARARSLSGAMLSLPDMFTKFLDVSEEERTWDSHMQHAAKFLIGHMHEHGNAELRTRPGLATKKSGLGRTHVPRAPGPPRHVPLSVPAEGCVS